MRLGVTSIEFYDLSPVEFFYAMEEFGKRDEHQHKLVFEAMRLNTFYLVNVQLDRKNRIKKVTDLMHFPWDNKEKTKEIHTQSVEEMKQVLKSIVQVFKKK